MRLPFPMLLVSVLAITAIASAAGADDHPPGPPPAPPPQAYSACESKSGGDACVVHLFDKDIDGTCRPDRDGGKLFCMPNHMPGPPRIGP